MYFVQIYRFYTDWNVLYLLTVKLVCWLKFFFIQFSRKSYDDL